MSEAKSPAREPELFELSLLGGAVERHYRSQRPHAEAMPWGTLQLCDLTAAQLELARRLWTDLTLAEYAAAALHANILRLVVRARAPLDLSAMLAGFPLDELAHTELCARVTEELGGATPLQYDVEHVFPSALPPTEDRPLALAARYVAAEFCVNETYSHALLSFNHRHAPQPLLEAVWGRLARDEAGHAHFGWEFLEWAAPELEDAERKAVANSARSALRAYEKLTEDTARLEDDAFVSVGVFGARGRDAYVEVGRRVVRERIVPGLRALGVGWED